MELKDLAVLMLKTERSQGNVDVEVLANLLRGGKEMRDRRKYWVNLIKQHPVLSDRAMDTRNHQQRYEKGLEKIYHYIKFLQEHNVETPEDRDFTYRAMGEPIGIDVHNAMFIPTLELQGTDEQIAKWVPLARKAKILGAYAQTELGHGSNVQGIETTATYDEKTQEFIIHSPTLTSRKWWPGGLAKTATHAVVHARLNLKGKDVGVQAFLVQLRSLEDHTTLPGVQLGDIGAKVGFNAIDNGYCVLTHVRIPRDQMLMRYAQVLPDGTFIQPKSDKLVYVTMVRVRSTLVSINSMALGAAVTITTRFSAARLQGRKPDGLGSKGEFQVLDYQNQQSKLFPLLALSYAGSFAGARLKAKYDIVVKAVTTHDPAFGPLLAELHAMSSGLKSWVADRISNGVETLRRMCGGHGFTQNSNLAHIFAENVGACTFEGTHDVLVQQHSRYLLKALMNLSIHKDAAVSSLVPPFLTKVEKYVDPSYHCKEITCSKDWHKLPVLVELFEIRAARLLMQLARQMRATKNDANACMVLMTRVSEAHSELVLVSSMVDALEETVLKQKETASTRTALSDLTVMFGTHLILMKLGDFRDNDLLSSKQADFAQSEFLALLPVIRKNAVLLSDAWDFTDFELNSAIGQYDGDIYRALVKRAEQEPLNKTDVPNGYKEYLRPLIRSDM